LRTPAFDALIDVMHEARLVRFGAGKAHLGAAFHALWVFVETFGLVLCHCPTAWLMLASCWLRFHNLKVAATNQNLPFTRWRCCELFRTANTNCQNLKTGHCVFKLGRWGRNRPNGNFGTVLIRILDI